MTVKLNQTQVDVIHRMRREGKTCTAIAKRFDVKKSTISQVIRTRPPTSSGKGGEKCSRCGGHFGSRRVRRLASHTFCLDCHKWVFDPKNMAAVKKEFSGIF